MNRHQPQAADAKRPKDPLNAAGGIVQQFRNPKTNTPMITIRRLPGGIVVDVEDEDAMWFMSHFLTKTRTGIATTKTGEKKYRFLYIDPEPVPS